MEAGGHASSISKKSAAPSDQGAKIKEDPSETGGFFLCR
jgi:hypothetical protein